MKYILGSDSLTAFVQGKPYTVNRSAEIFKAAMDAVRNDSEEDFLKVVTVKAVIAKALSASKDVVIQNNQVLCNGREITGILGKRVFDMLDNKLDVTPLLNFISNLMKNPSKRAVDETFGFVDACSLPITEDGCILAYRRVKNDYTDVHTGTVLNKPAELFTKKEKMLFPISCGKQNEVIVEVSKETGRTLIKMERNMVDDNKDRTCSSGLHAASYEYLKHFSGSRIIAVKINPKDICSVPSDYQNSKLRTCSYEILEELPLDEENMPKDQLSIKHVEKHSNSNVKHYSTTIREDFLNGKKVKQLCNDYNMSRRQVVRIIKHEAWSSKGQGSLSS